MTSTPSLNPYLAKFWKTKARNRVLHGGRSSSKSWDAAGMAIFLAQYCKIRVLCTRQFQNKISESVYALLKIQIERFDVGHDFDITKNSIKCISTGSEFMFYGLARNIDEIKSMESIDILWIEEAHNLTKGQWEILEPTIRKQGSQIWVIFNPKFATDFVYQRFIVNPPPKTVVQQINYVDNPYLSETIIDVIGAAKEEDEDDYEHIYLGVPKDDDDGVVIKRSWLEACVDAHIKLDVPMQGKKVTGYDVADDGNDKNATASFDGCICVEIDEWKADTDDLVKSSNRARANAEKIKAEIVYDSIGVGASTGSNLNSQGFRKHAKFIAGAKVARPKQRYNDVPNAEFFSNLKAQAWWQVADRARNTYNALNNGHKFNSDEMLSISSSVKYLERLKTELSTPKRDFDKAGRVKVESKDDLAKREVDSPNLADAFIMGASISLVASSMNNSNIRMAF